MYWLLSLSGALLVAVILTVLLSGAFGRWDGTSMSSASPAQEEHWRQLTTAPITAESVREVRFSLSLRGYSPREVDAFLDRALQRIAELEAERED